MAITDNIALRVYPLAGDTAPYDIVSAANFTGTATASLVDVGAEKAWSVTGGTLTKALASSYEIAGGGTNTGATFAFRFRVTNMGTGDFSRLLEIDTGSATGLKLTKSGANTRCRFASSALTVVTSGVTFLNNTVTLVYRVSNRPGIGATHEGALWWNVVGRGNNEPQVRVVGNVSGTKTLTQAIIDVADASYSVLDLVYWNRELYDAEAAAVADDIRGTIPAPSSSSTPVAFAGSVANQTGIEGTAFSLNLSTYFSGTETPFGYSAQTGTLPAGLSLNSSTGVISGTPTTAGVSSGIVIRATDATPDTADTNSFTITIDEAGAPADTDPPELTGVVTFTSVTQTSYTASWPAGSDNVAVTGYEYQIGGTAGTWTDAGNNLSAAVTGRTAGTTETVYVRAYDAVGLRSTPAISGEVTLLAAVAGVTVLEPLKSNPGTVLASQSGVRVSVLQAADLVSVYETSGLTTNASGLLATISDAAITAGQQYHVVIKLADGGVGITGPITAS